jgi:hypothetical protein
MAMTLDDLLRMSEPTRRLDRHGDAPDDGKLVVNPAPAADLRTNLVFDGVVIGATFVGDVMGRLIPATIGQRSVFIVPVMLLDVIASQKRRFSRRHEA